MDGQKDEVVPSARWEFDSNVAAAFDDMLARSIPQIDVMRDSVHQVARQHVVPMAPIVDLGCSRGGALARFVDEFGVSNRYYGVDVSEPMLAAARERFAKMDGVVQIENRDLRTSYPDVGVACVTTAVLTLQFVPINYRQQIMRQVYGHTLPGGAFVVVEKILGNGARVDDMLVSLYHRFKEQSGGYSREAIARKAASLEGVLVPVTAEMNEQMLRSAGFREVDCFWRWMNFAAWVAIKGG
jgi:tRNA (cmo5U34)-methyltransferase